MEDDEKRFGIRLFNHHTGQFFLVKKIKWDWILGFMLIAHEEDMDEKIKPQIMSIYIRGFEPAMMILLLIITICIGFWIF